MNESKTTIGNKMFAIGILSITAVILFVGFLMVTITPPAAKAESMNDRGGDFIMVTNRLSENKEAVVIMDAASKRMILYTWDPSRKQIRAAGRFDLERATDGKRDRGRRRR